MAVSTSYSAKHNAGTLNTPRYVVIHGTTGSTDKGDLATLTTGGGKKVSAHILIGRDGTRYRLLPDNVGANHAGYSNAPLAKSLPPNTNALSIELSNNQKGEAYTPAQLTALRDQLAEWNAAHGTLPIVAHGMIDPSRRTDPVGLNLADFGTVLNPDSSLPTPKTGTTKSGGSTMATSSGVPGTTVDRVLATIRKRESGGDYTQPGSKLGGSASGAYQFIDSTWRSAAGKDIAAKYPRAYMAPASVQDAVARKEVQKILDANGGNVKAVPAYWFYPAGAKKALSGVDVQPPGSGNPSMLTYLNSWMKDYEKTAGKAGTGSGEAARLGTTPANAATATPVVGGALGALTSFTGAPGASQPTQPYVPMTTLPDLGMAQPSQELPMPGMDAQARTSALNLLMQMGASGATGRMRIMFDPRTGKTVTVPAGG